METWIAKMNLKNNAKVQLNSYNVGFRRGESKAKGKENIPSQSGAYDR